MKKKALTFSLGIIVFVLLASIGIVSYTLHNTSSTAATVAQKTQAAALTYNKTITLSTPTPIPTISQPNANNSGPASMTGPTPATSEPLLVSPSPTLAVGSPSATIQPLVQSVQSLPESGFTKYGIMLGLGAGALILISFIM